MFQFKMYIKVREHARERFMKAATKMENRYNAKKAGKEIWWLRIPKIDHTSTDMPRFPCLVVKVHGKA